MGEADIAGAETAFTRAEEAFVAGNFEQALSDYNLAIDGGGLRSELYAEALIHRAICHGELGNFDQAFADLEMAAQGAPNMDEVHAARGQVYLKQGDTPRARKQYKLARDINPQVELPSGL